MHTVIVGPCVVTMDFHPPLEERGSRHKSRDKPRLTPLNSGRLDEGGAVLLLLLRLEGTGLGHLRARSHGHGLAAKSRNLLYVSKF